MWRQQRMRGAQPVTHTLELPVIGLIRTPGCASSNVKSTIFQDRKLPFCCFRSKKDRMETFFNQNSGSKQNVFCQFSTFFDQKLLFCSVSKKFLNYLNVLFCLWKTLAQFVRFWFRFDIIF
jgi:hypothetical protein